MWSMSNTIRRNVIYNTIYQVLLVIVPFVLTPYLARVLGSEGLGTYSYHYSCTYYFMMIAMLGLQNYGSRSIARVSANEEERSKVFSSIFSLQLCTSGLATALYLFYMIFICHGELIVVVMSGFILSCMMDITWFYSGMEKFKLTVLRNTIIKVGTLICTLLFVKDEGDVVKYACIVVGGTMLSNLCLVSPLRKYVHWKTPAWKEIGNHIKPNLIIFAAAFSVSLYIDMDKIMLGQMTNMSEVGFYTSSERFLKLPMLLPVALNTVMLARMSHIAGREEKREKELVNRSLELAMMIVSAASFGISGIADLIVPAFFGNGFEKCVSLLMIMLPSRLFVCFTNVIHSHYLMPYNRDWLSMAARLVGAVVNISANLLLIPRFESIGAAIATFMAEIAVCVVQCWGIRKSIPINQYLNNVIPYIGAGILMWGGLRIVGRYIQLGFWSQLIINITVGIILYFGCLIGCNIFFHKCSLVDEFRKGILLYIKKYQKG